MQLFCYGALMNPRVWEDNLELHIPHLYDANAILYDHQLVFDGQSRLRGGATANICEKPGSVVWGVLYTLSVQDLKQVDLYEGFPEFYDRKHVWVWDEDGYLRPVWVYFRQDFPEGKPVRSYLDDLIEGATYHHLPPAYIEHVRSTKTLER